MSLSASAPWLAYYGSTPATIDYPDKTMFQLLQGTATQYPNNTAYIFQGKKTTFAQFMTRIESAARGLVAMGIGKGDTFILHFAFYILHCRLCRLHDKLKFAIYSVIISLYKENFQHFVKKLRIYKFYLCMARKGCIIVTE